MLIDILWHINPCGLFNTKYRFLISMICKRIFLNELLSHICLHIVKWFQVLLFNISNSIYQVFLCDNVTYWCREIRNTEDSLFRYETFIHFLTFSLSTRREGDNFYYADCSYVTHSQLPSWTAWPRVKSQLTAFSKITKFTAPRFQAWCHSHPSHLLSGVFIMTFVNCTQCVCTCTKSLIVQSPTKLNDKI